MMPTQLHVSSNPGLTKACAFGNCDSTLLRITAARNLLEPVLFLQIAKPPFDQLAIQAVQSERAALAPSVAIAVDALEVFGIGGKLQENGFVHLVFFEQTALFILRPAAAGARVVSADFHFFG